MIYMLIALELTPGGSSTEHIYTQKQNTYFCVVNIARFCVGFRHA
jgi:hypothetical protein